MEYDLTGIALFGSDAKEDSSRGHQGGRSLTIRGNSTCDHRMYKKAGQEMER